MKAKIQKIERLVDKRFEHVDQMCAEVKRWDLDFRPLADVYTAKHAGRICQLVVGPLFTAYAHFHAPLHQKVAPPKGLVTFTVMEPSVRRHWWRGFDVDANTLLISPPGSDFESFSELNYRVHTISMSVQALEEAAAAEEIDMPALSSFPEVVQLTNEQAERIRRPLRHWQLGNSNSADVSLLLREFVMLLARKSMKARSRPASRMRDKAICRCLNALSDMLGQHIDATELRMISGVSERTLEYAFRERFEIGPASFIKYVELGRLRSDLLQSDPVTTRIGDLAARYGFWHAGHLSADYKRLFGERPSETLSRTNMGA